MRGATSFVRRVVARDVDGRIAIQPAEHRRDAQRDSHTRHPLAVEDRSFRRSSSGSCGSAGERSRRAVQTIREVAVDLRAVRETLSSGDRPFVSSASSAAPQSPRSGARDRERSREWQRQP
jgi:hypothetical protein